MRRCCSRFTRGEPPCWNGGCDFPTHLQALSRRAIFKCPGGARSGCSCCAQMIGFQRSPWRGPMLFCDPAEEPCSATNPSNQAELFFTAKTRSARRKAEESFAVGKGFLRPPFFSRSFRSLRVFAVNLRLDVFEIWFDFCHLWRNHSSVR